MYFVPLPNTCCRRDTGAWIPADAEEADGRRPWIRIVSEDCRGLTQYSTVLSDSLLAFLRSQSDTVVEMSYVSDVHDVEAYIHDNAGPKPIGKDQRDVPLCKVEPTAR